MVLSRAAERKRSLRKRIDELTFAGSRYLDFALRLCVVERDSEGSLYLPVAQVSDVPFKLLSEHRYGGKYDRFQRRFVGPAENYLTLYISPKQWEAIKRDADPHCFCTLIFGAKGAGKSTIGAIWTLIQIIAYSTNKTQVWIGVSSPTNDKLQQAIKIIQELYPASWWEWREKAHEFLFATNVGVWCRGTQTRANDGSTRWDAVNLVAAWNDEWQDSININPDIDHQVEFRGRRAVKGRFKRFATATPSFNPLWRRWREAIKDRPRWRERTVTGPDNPFVPVEQWERLRDDLPGYEYDRQVLAKDVPPQTIVYNSFGFGLHRKPLPSHAQDITREVTGSYSLVIGHDPGSRWSVSIFLKCFSIDHERVWFVVKEFATLDQTEDSHAAELAYILGEQYSRDNALVLTDPSQKFNNSHELSQGQVLSTLKRHGLTARKAYHKIIRPEDRVEMLNRLFLSHSKMTRLYIGQTLDVATGQYVDTAPELVNALMTQERHKVTNAAEWQRKDRDNVTHYTSALAFGLYRFERARATQSISYGAAY